MSTLHIQGGRIIDPANQRDAQADLWVHEGKIVESLTPEQQRNALVVDARGCIVCPGFVDMHVHLREPGQSHKETIATGTQAAAAGGFTTVVCMPNTAPVADNVGVVTWVQEQVRKVGVVNVYPTGTITIGSQGRQLAPLEALKEAGVIAITDDGHCVQSNQVMYTALQYAQMLDLLVMDHCQDNSLTDGAVAHEGSVALRLGLKGWPSVAETIIVSRNILLAEQTGARVHLQHITSANSVPLIREAKQRGIAITAEVSPHHLALTDQALEHYETCYKMNPPLRTESDRQALIKGLLDGIIDVIATDHAPHAWHEKAVEFDAAPFGIIGLETALAVCLETLYHTGLCDLPFLINCLSAKPAAILGLSKGTLSIGADADITLFDPTARWTFNDTTRFSRSSNSPWDGKELRGQVQTTIVGGQIVFEKQPGEAPSLYAC